MLYIYYRMEEYLEKSIFTNFNDEFSKWKETKDKEIAQFYRSFSKFENKLNDSYKILVFINIQELYSIHLVQKQKGVDYFLEI